MDTIHTTNPEDGYALDEEVRLIPRWSLVLATVGFLAMQYVHWFILPGTRKHQPPIGFRIYFALSWSALVAMYFLLVGYISQDAPRRSMSRRFWILVQLFMPPGIGTVLYFLLRQPIMLRCPSCGTDVQSEYHFCPQCNWQLTASCGRCYHRVSTTDLYCTRCGHDLAEDNTPARLRAYQR